MKTEELLTQIETIRSRYQNACTSNNIDLLLEYQDKMACLNSTLGDSIADFKEQYYNAEYLRDLEIEEAKLYNIDKGIGVTEAGSRAKVKCKDRIKEARELKAIWYKLNEKGKNNKGILSAMQQRLSYSKDEWKLKKFIQNKS